MDGQRRAPAAVEALRSSRRDRTIESFPASAPAAQLAAPSRFSVGRKSAGLGSESRRVAALGCVRGRFALHWAVLIETDQADLPSARSWREPSGAGHVGLDALCLRVPVCHAGE